MDIMSTQVAWLTDRWHTQLHTMLSKNMFGLCCRDDARGCLLMTVYFWMFEEMSYNWNNFLKKGCTAMTETTI